LAALEEAARNHDMDLWTFLTGGDGALDGEPRYEAVRQRVFGSRPAPRRWPSAQRRSP
jgi:hypothetical protein